MKRNKWFVSLTLLFLSAYFTPAGRALPSMPPTEGGNSPLSLSLSVSGGKFEAGAPIIVTITLTNNSKGDIVWQSERPDPAYRNFWFELKTGAGADVPTTVYHRKIRGKQLPEDPTDVDSGSSMFATLSPGQSVNFTVDVRRLYKVEQSGTYVLVVGRDDQLNKIKIHSEPLHIVLAP